MKTFSTTTRKNIVATLIAPLAVIPATLLISLYSLITQDSSVTKLASEAMIFIFIGLLYSYAVTSIIGFSSVLILKRFQRFNLVNTLIVAVFVATLVSFLTIFTVSTWMFSLYYALIVAYLYWYVFHKVANKI